MLEKFVNDFSKAAIIFHIDLDGVTSAIALKEILKSHGIKSEYFIPIQYGNKEHTIPKIPDNVLVCLVDFANGKSIVHFWTDHHDVNHLGAEDKLTYFVNGKSNAEYICGLDKFDIELFSPQELHYISMIDSADFFVNEVLPNDVIFIDFNNECSIKKNVLNTNKLLLAFKNKKGFLESIVKYCKPSIKNIYNYMVEWLKLNNFDYIKYNDKTLNYIERQKRNRISFNVNDIKNMKSGQYMYKNGIIVQYGGGYLFDGGYDRYIPFYHFPEAKYLCICWPMGLIQISKNPFVKDKDNIDLSTINKLILNFVSKFYKEISLLDIKKIYEKDLKSGENSIGYGFYDFFNTYKDIINIRNKELFESIMKKPFYKLSFKERQILGYIKISVFDIINRTSGGHKNITNISGFNFFGIGYVDIMKEVFAHSVGTLSLFISEKI